MNTSAVLMKKRTPLGVINPDYHLCHQIIQEREKREAALKLDK